MIASLEVKVIGLLLIISSLVFGGWYLHHNGYNEGKAEVDAEIAKANMQATADLAAKNAVIEAKQKELDDSFIQISNKDKEIQGAKQSYQTLLDQYHSGLKRLSIRTNSARNTTGNNQVTTDSAGTTGQNTFLMPDVSVAILDFAKDYSRNLRLKNECIDLLKAERAVK